MASSFTSILYSSWNKCVCENGCGQKRADNFSKMRDHFSSENQRLIHWKLFDESEVNNFKIIRWYNLQKFVLASEARILS